MSLLLQALKQIDAKPPDDAAVGPPVCDPEKAAVNESAAFVASSETQEAACEEESAADGLANISPSFIVAQASAAEAPAAPSDDAIHTIRHYDETETISAIAFADRFDLDALPFPTMHDEGAGVAPRRRRETRHLAGEMLALLPDESRAVVAVLSADGGDVSPLVLDICQELADRRAGEVLAIIDCHAGLAPGLSGKATLSDVIAGRAVWREALVNRRDDRCALLSRGDTRVVTAGSRRRLLKLWDELGEEFSFVVLGVAGGADEALPILATCDAAFLALRLHETRRHDAERLIATIRAAGCHPCGCLVGEAF